MTEGPARLPASAVAAGSDWHNRYADAVLSLTQALDAATDDAARDRILNQVRTALKPVARTAVNSGPSPEGKAPSPSR
ncbi:MAG: hypothetical protein HYS20_02840 [Rhodocyclales bacterium]|nr:hypothetical protein [Rhodocyclales bacterium]